MRSLLASLVVLAALVVPVVPMLDGGGGSAWARSEKTLAYPREQVWPTVVRFLRVDERLKVTEKDAEAGYVLFELADDGKTYRGSLEVLTVVVDGRTSARFIIQIEDRPSWIEIAMLKRLERKLRAELGSPSPPPTRPRDPPKDQEPSKEPPRPEDGGPPISPTP